jgi:molecular chaperone DnaK (HSP70)
LEAAANLGDRYPQKSSPMAASTKSTVAPAPDATRGRTRAADVQRVFMTGGTSFVPAVRRIFDERFGHEKIRAGGEMISVATGLALRARSGAIT